MLHSILELDKNFFLFLNGFHSESWDSIMWWASRTITWVPLYLVLLVIIIYQERPYRFLFTILFLALVVLLNDQISVVIKNLVERPRPTHNPDIADMVHVVRGYRGGPFGFVSSHAANVFGVATFLAYQFKNAKTGFFLILWALFVSYSRIYLGVHYPLDILAGALLGVLIGMMCYVFKVKAAVATDRYFEKRRRNRISR